jgi:two-component system sensor histidine kinase YesM
MKRKQVARLLKTIRFKTIKSRLITVSLIFLAVGIFLPVQITSLLHLAQIQQKNESETVSRFNYTAMKLNEILGSAMTSAMLLQSEDAVYNYLTTEYSNNDFLKKTMDRISFLDAIQPYFYSARDLNAVLFFRQDGTMCGASRTWNFFMEDSSHPFYNDVVKKSIITHKTVWLGTYPMSEFTLATSTDQASADELMICGLRKVTYALQPGKRKDLIMLVSVKEESVRESFSYLSDEDSSVYLLDGSGALISGGNMSKLGVIPEFYYKINLENKYGSISYTTAKDIDYQIIYYQLENPDWILIKQTPTSIRYKSINLLRKTSYIVGTAFILLACILYSVWVISFTRPIKQITEGLTQVYKGNLSVHINESSNIEEINRMQKHFNQMIRSINDLLKQKEKDEQEKMMLEFRNLQAQINPHFIYNSITSIRWMATLSGAEKVSDMLVVLSELLHPVFSDWTIDWTLKEELNFSENYIRLMRLRTGNQVNMEINSDLDMEANESIRIPRFVLQPLLENSCEHGMVRGQSLRIKIQISYESEKLNIYVMDNGIGFNDETMTRLNEVFSAPLASEKTESRQKRSRGIGLINVNKRLKLHYGDAYGLTIISPPKDWSSCIKMETKV